MKPSLLLLASSTVLLCGCGGGGASGPPVTPATAMRANGAGDAWSYQVTATLPIVGAGYGTLTQIISTDTYLTQPSIRDTQTFNLKTSSDGVATISTYSESSPTGSLEAVIDGSSLVAVTGETFQLPAQIDSTTNVSGALTLADGTKVSTNYKVVGAERVGTTAGTFDCWLVEEQQTHSDGTTDYFVLDVAPQIGNWVKARAHTVYSGGQTFDWTATLFSITTP